MKIKVLFGGIKRSNRKDSEVYDMAIQFKLSLKNLIDKPEELLDFIDSCLKPKQKEKQENGEVFTPMNIIFEMLDNLDKHYQTENKRSVFSEKNFKWFDPASGMGNFPVAVYLRLMEGLTNIIQDEEERKKHIIENMLYMSELNKKNVFICHQIFNIDGKYKMNLYEGDTLEMKIEEKFDVVLGNPPYNKGGIRSSTGKKLGDKNETIWPKFTELSLELLKPNGFLIFITPLSWLKKSHSLHEILLKNHIIWLKLWDNSQSKATIYADIPISLYILQNKNNKGKKTEIISILKRRNLKTESLVYLNPEHSIPLAYHNIFAKLSTFIENKNCKLEYKTKTVKSSGSKEKLPESYSIEDNLAVDTYTLKEGLLVKKTIEKHPDINKSKLIISNKSSFRGAFIDDGRLSLTGSDKVYILGENLELIQKILSFKVCEIISHFTKYRQDFLEKEAYNYIPDLRKLNIEDIEEDGFYEMIGFSKEELDQIKGIQSNISITKGNVDSDFSKKTVIELKTLIKDMGIKAPLSKLKKSELIDLISSKEQIPVSVQEVVSQESLSKKTVIQLKEIIKEMGIKKAISKLKKAELIQCIIDKKQ